MWRNYIKCKYMFMFPVKNLAPKGLSLLLHLIHYHDGSDIADCTYLGEFHKTFYILSTWSNGDENLTFISQIALYLHNMKPKVFGKWEYLMWNNKNIIWQIFPLSDWFSFLSWHCVSLFTHGYIGRHQVLAGICWCIIYPGLCRTEWEGKM